MATTEKRAGKTTAKITSKGQITIPKAVRERLGVGPGDRLEFVIEGDRIAVRPIKRRGIMDFYGIFPVDEAYDIAVERAYSRAVRAKRRVAEQTDDA